MLKKKINYFLKEIMTYKLNNNKITKKLKIKKLFRIKIKK